MWSFANEDPWPSKSGHEPSIKHTQGSKQWNVLAMLKWLQITFSTFLILIAQYCINTNSTSRRKKISTFRPAWWTVAFRYLFSGASFTFLDDFRDKMLFLIPFAHFFWIRFVPEAKMGKIQILCHTLIFLPSFSFADF